MAQQESTGGAPRPADQQEAQSGTAQMINAIRTGIGPKTADAKKTSYWDDVILEFLRRVASGSLSFDEDLATALDQHIAAIDERIARQIDAIMHHPKFQRLEASWRGLSDLVRKTDVDRNIKVRVLPVKRDELQKDLVSGKKLEQTTLYRRAYRSGIGTLHGQPVGMIVGDFEFGYSTKDVQLLDRLGQLGQQCMAPFVTAASPEVFDKSSFSEIASWNKSDLTAHFQNDLYAEWRGLRDREYSKFIGLCAPRVLLRGAHELSPEQGFSYVENVSNPDGSGFLWGNGAYAFAERVHRSFADHGWCLAMRGVEGGGKLEGLPVINYTTDRGDRVQWPVEVAFDHSQDMTMSELGFIPIVHLQRESSAAIVDAPSFHQRAGYTKDKDNAKEFLSSQLPYTFVLSRFGHYIKHALVDRIGTSMSRQQIEDFLHEWIHRYVEDSDTVSLEVRAKKPLRKASVVVMEVPGRPGAYSAVITLVPHFLLEDVTVHMTLGADLEDKKG